jgi:hypothetical protein
MAAEINLMHGILADAMDGQCRQDEHQRHRQWAMEPACVQPAANEPVAWQPDNATKRHCCNRNQHGSRNQRNGVNDAMT